MLILQLENHALQSSEAFAKYIKIFQMLELFLSGKSQPDFPDDLSAKYALTTALATEQKTVKEVKKHAFLHIEKNR